MDNTNTSMQNNTVGMSAQQQMQLPTNLPKAQPFNGLAIITIDNISAEGLFIDGKFTKGTLIKDSAKYNGTFENDKLHGVNCSYENGNILLDGEFQYGYMTKGSKLRNYKLIEKGDFTLVNTNMVLVKGSRYSDEKYYSGEFDRYGRFTKGVIIYKNGVQYNGVFGRDEVMNDGIVTYPNKFMAKYNLVYDFERHIEILNSCSVEYSGKFEDLNTKQCVMLCCSGPDSKLAHKFYIDFLQEFSANSLALLKRSFFASNLSHLQEAGLMQILTNIESYLTKGYCNIVNYQKIEDPKPFETERYESDHC